MRPSLEIRLILAQIFSMNYFYLEDPVNSPYLDKEESHHCVKVLRKRSGDKIEIMDGKGALYTCEIVDDNFRKCGFTILDKKASDRINPSKIHIAIAPTKNHDRIEWFVEKTAEMGLDDISLILSKRTERKKINIERLERKTVSALKQSRNLFKTSIKGCFSFEDFVAQSKDYQQKFIAFVDSSNPDYLHKVAEPGKDTLILIGPEGDFTDDEVALARSHDFHKVSLGKSVLRTETAGVVACHTMTLIND